MNAEIGKAPSPPPWPDDLPPALTSAEGTLLPPELAEEVVFRLDLLDLYPMVCQASLDAQRTVMQAQTDDAVLAEIAKGKRALLEQAAAAPAPGWAWYEVALTAGAAVVGGLLIGYVGGTLQ